MKEKLTEITPSYRSFENDQVLTAGQLNRFLDYFDDQDRLTRICLSGVGLVCGFSLNYDQVTGQLVISQGTGITTDGDILKLQVSVPDTDGLKSIDIEQIVYTKFRVFDDANAHYLPFFYKDLPGGGQEQIKLWELLPDDSDLSSDLISSLPDQQEKVVLLYLETYNENSDICVGQTCDNLGVLQVQNLRVLAVNREDADYILSFDNIFQANDLLSAYYNLPDLVAPRVLINQSNAQGFAQLSLSYTAAILQDGNLAALQTGLKNMLIKLGLTTEWSQLEQLISSVFNISGLPQNKLFFQYLYDLFRDVLETYQELKELFVHANCLCSPDIHAFPKHLLLGKLIPTSQDTLYQNYRHNFYKSCALCCEDDDFSKFNSLVYRLIEQLSTYYRQSIPSGDVQITPSGWGTRPNKKAIPFYYKLNQQLLNKWDFEKTKKNAQNRNLSFHKTLLSSAPAIQKPLKYDLEPFNFFRIEGHQGMLYKEAFDQIETIKGSNGLAFDLKVLGITVASDFEIDTDEYACEFEDLNAVLEAWKTEYQCALANASYYFSGYSLLNPGRNFRKIEFLNPITVKTINTVKTGNNIVQENLYTGEEAIGKVINTAFVTNDGCSANDIIVKVNRELSTYDFRNWDPVEYDITINKPMEILSNAFVMVDKMPTGIKEITSTRIDSLAINESTICSLAKKTQAVAKSEIPPSPAPSYTPSETASVSAISKQYYKGDYSTDYSADFYVTNLPATSVKEPAMVDLLMNQLADLCCSSKKLKLLYDEIEARKQQIILRLKLAEFIKNNPGLEHRAGTTAGGTFILVYITKSLNSIPANTVVADFMLPYSCCSDCAPVNYVMERPTVSLVLSQSIFCMGNDNSPLSFTPFPEDGVITAVQSITGVTIEGTQLFIDSTNIPDAALGIPLYFMVNGIPTSCNLTIYKVQEVNFEVSESPTTDTLVTFIPTGDIEEGSTYLWDFGDGSVSTLKTVSHQYATPVKEMIVTVTLTVTPASGACPAVISKQIQFVS